jgi:hypothetical protein
MQTLLEKLSLQKKRERENEITAPCSTCGCPLLWQDIYSGPSGPWRCFHCQPPPLWPAETFVRRWVDVRNSRTIQPATDAAGEVLDDLAAFQRDWECYDLAGGLAGGEANGGARVAVIRRRGNGRHVCPRDQPLAEWVAGLRTRLLVEDLIAEIVGVLNEKHNV